MMRFKPGALLAELKRMKSGTGRMRNVTGLAPVVIQRAIQKDEAPDDIAEVMVEYLGEGILLHPPTPEGPAVEAEAVEVEAEIEVVEDEPDAEVEAEVESEDEGEVKEEVLPEIDLTLSVEKIIAKVEAGEWPAQAVLELESKSENPRSTLFTGLEELS